MSRPILLAALGLLLLATPATALPVHETSGPGECGNDGSGEGEFYYWIVWVPLVDGTEAWIHNACSTDNYTYGHHSFSVGARAAGMTLAEVEWYEHWDDSSAYCWVSVEAPLYEYGDTMCSITGPPQQLWNTLP